MFVLIAGIFFTSDLHAAACIGSSPNLTAASASYADVSDCVAVSTYGDTIRIPAGDATWTSGIWINKDIKIIGNGVDSTILRSGFVADGAVDAFFKFAPDLTSRERLKDLSSAETFEVSNITFTGSRVIYKYGVYIGNDSLPAIRRVKIHKNKYINLHRAAQVNGYIHGVFYNNVLIDTNASYPQGNGRLSFSNDRFSPGSGSGWYIEDNTFSFNGIDALVCGAGNHGGGYVARYNTITGTLSGKSTYFETHGNQPQYIYGPQITEVYGNNIIATGASRLTNARGGKNIYLNNVAANGWISIWEEYGDIKTSSTYPENRCPEIPGVRQTCTDSCVCQKVHDSYFINNRPTVNGPVLAASVTMDYKDRANNILNDPPEIVENIEYFNHEVSGFDGTKGVGCGTSGNRPSSCKVGVGYWATYQSCTDLSGMVGANPSTPISGTLWKCTAPNTWTTYYTPYTYPHPLRGESSVSSVTPTSTNTPTDTSVTSTTTPTTSTTPTSTSTETSATSETTSTTPATTSRIKKVPKGRQ